ncbi:MAG: response regulator [Pontibacterium sp.]
MSKALNKILLVDDEADIREVATMALELTGGFEIITCENGQQALDRVADINPDLILLDVMMPLLDGPSTLKQLTEKQLVDHIPVVFMTAKVQPREVTEYRALGAADVIAKPFDPMQLADQIKQIWEVHQP